MARCGFRVPLLISKIYIFFWFSESSFASYPGSISWLQEQEAKDEVFEANNENVVRLDSRRRSANNNNINRKCC